MRKINLRALALDAERDPALWEQRKCPKCGTSQIYSGRERGWVHRYPDDQAACSKAKDAFAPHKFEVMPGNKPGRPCNRCLEYKNHANHDSRAIAEYEAGKAGRARHEQLMAEAKRREHADKRYKAKDDREYPMPVHRLTGRNPDRCAQCGRPQSDLIHNCTNRFATDRRAKDQVPQDCFDAQILGV